ncbi:MAG: triacylglycerol lipase [Lachnospiraceae bacterium]|nr:triacylglycerol lipase [Lachnospiraceae bacterium]
MQRMKKVLFTLALTVSMNMAGILLVTRTGGMRAVLLTAAAVLFFLYVNVVPPAGCAVGHPADTKRLRQLGSGCVLILYAGATFLPGLVWQFWCFHVMPERTTGRLLLYILSVLFWLCGEGILLLNGCLRLMLTSVQLGIRYRVLLCLCWWVPFVNLFLFYRLYQLAILEYETELEKEELNAVRKESECCHTKYPLLMVHGVFFRDFRFLNYWGRIPKELIRNGAVIYYGNQQSAASVAVCGQELAERIEQIVKETGCGKVNIIAHSKGGLDARHAISKYGIAEHVASLTTINTPHRGCFFADYLLEKAPTGLRDFLAARYNGTLRRLGDRSPDFLSAVTDLTAAACLARNGHLPDHNSVYYQSVATAMPEAQSGRFPLNVSYHLVKHFDGENDGLVSIDSALWRDVYAILRPKGGRGISHGDMIDLNRENIPGFDVREFYVNLVKDLKEKGF